MNFDFVKGEGPSVDNPIRTADDVERLNRFEPRESLKHVLETIRLLRRELEGRVPLIGFGGAPFTLAAYAIEGGPSTTYARTKAFMYAQPAAWHRLCSRFADMMADYLAAQVEAGVQALQVFDSWAGALGRSDYREFALPHTSRIFSALKGTGVPLIHFAVNTAAILGDVAENGGRRHRRRLAPATSTRRGPSSATERAIQGNLDPALLLGPRERMLRRHRRRSCSRAARPARAHLQSRPRRACRRRRSRPCRRLRATFTK